MVQNKPASESICTAKLGLLLFVEDGVIGIFAQIEQFALKFPMDACIPSQYTESLA